MKPYTYLFVNIACILIPLIASFYKKYPFQKEWKYFLPANIIIAILFLIWDVWFTEIGIWGFNTDYLTGIYLYNLPLEEILFFICIPYSCVFTYFVCKKYIPNKLFSFPSLVIRFFLIVLCVVAIVMYNEKMYTLWTSTSLLFSLIFVWIKKINIRIMIFSYIMIFPFFLLSNGILTGSIIDKPIVWYNNMENIGVRMFTIPIEDSFYGFLLILLNILLYEYLKKEKIF